MCQNSRKNWMKIGLYFHCFLWTSMALQSADNSNSCAGGQNAPAVFAATPRIARIFQRPRPAYPLHLVVALSDISDAELAALAAFLDNQRYGSVNVPDEVGDTPLRYAATLQVAQLLVKCGANVNHKGFARCTPLYRTLFTGWTPFRNIWSSVGRW